MEVTTCNHLVAIPTSQTITSAFLFNTQVRSNSWWVLLPRCSCSQGLCLLHSGIWRTFSSLSASHVSHGGNNCRQPGHIPLFAQQSAFSSGQSSLQSTGTNGDMGPQDRIRGSALSGSRPTHCAPGCSQSLWHSRSRGVDPQGWLVDVVDPGCRDTALGSMRGRVCCVLRRVVGRVDGLEPINSELSLDFERYERGRNAKGEESYNTRRPRVSANTASLIRQRNLEASADTLSPVRQSRSSARKEVLVTFEKKGARRRLRMGS